MIVLQAGELCATQFSEDGCWYRGQIIAVHGDQVQVLFLDYGNEESKRSSEVRNTSSILSYSHNNVTTDNSQYKRLTCDNLFGNIFFFKY